MVFFFFASRARAIAHLSHLYSLLLLLFLTLRKNLKTSIKIDEIETSLANFDGDGDLLAQRM